MQDREYPGGEFVVSVELVTEELRAVSGLGVDAAGLAVVQRRESGEFVLVLSTTDGEPEAHERARRAARSLGAAAKQRQLAGQQASGVRALADMIEKNPELTE